MREPDRDNPDDRDEREHQLDDTLHWPAGGKRAHGDERRASDDDSMQRTDTSEIPAERSGEPGADGHSPAATPQAMAAGGALAGATVATIIAGPVGTPIGALAGLAAGALGGWWASHAATSTRYEQADDEHYRRLYGESPFRLADRSFDHVRPAYQLGHMSAFNPEYAGREFEDIEPDLRRAWRDDFRRYSGEWDAVRHFAGDAYGHARSTGAGADALRDYRRVGAAGSAVDTREMRIIRERYEQYQIDAQRNAQVEDPSVGEMLGGSESHRRASFSDPAPPEELLTEEQGMSDDGTSGGSRELRS